MKNKIVVIGCWIMLFQCLLLHSAEIKVGGVIFAGYEFVTSKHLENGTMAQSMNSFDVPRVYLDINTKFNETLNGFVQYEANLISRDKTTNSVYLKQALLEINIYKGAKIKFGLIPTLWRSLEESIWKHRFVAKVLDDIEGLSPATDRGISLNWKASVFEYDIAVFNGEGTKSNESNKYKDISGKFAMSLFERNNKKIKLNLFYNNGSYSDGNNQERNRFIGGFSYESKKINAMANYYYSKTKGIEGNGISVHSVYNFSDINWFFARYDNYDPDRDIDNNTRSRVFIGLGHKIIDGVRVTLDYQFTIQEKQTQTSKNQSIISSHIELKF